MPQNDKHFILFKSSNIFCIVTGAYGQPYLFADLSISYQGLLEYYLLTPFHLKGQTLSAQEKKCQAILPYRP